MKDIHFQPKDIDFQDLYNELWDLELESIPFTGYGGFVGVLIANLNRLIYGSVKKVGNLEYHDFSKQPFRKRVPCTQCHPIVFEKTLLFKRQIQTFLGEQ